VYFLGVPAEPLDEEGQRYPPWFILALLTHTIASNLDASPEPAEERIGDQPAHLALELV
jgi:hypothetical protein